MPRIAVALLTFGIVCAPTAVSADPIHINAGALVADDFGGRMIASSPDRGFSINAFGDAAGGIYEPVQRCNFGAECAPGAIVGLDALWSGGDFPGAATVDGTSYELGGFSSASVLADFTGTWIAPPFSGDTTARVQAPFTFSGRFFFPDSPPRAGLDLTGSGVATLDLQWGSVASWNVRGTRYDFSASNVTPEPASLLLVASGAGILLRRRLCSFRL